MTANRRARSEVDVDVDRARVLTVAARTLAVLSLVGALVGATIVVQRIPRDVTWDAGWVLASTSLDGRAITVTTEHGDCTRIDRSAREYPDRVEISVLATSRPGMCTLMLNRAPTVVLLKEPLGDRRLVGCEGVAVRHGVYIGAAPSRCDEVRPWYGSPSFAIEAAGTDVIVRPTHRSTSSVEVLVLDARTGTPRQPTAEEVAGPEPVPPPDLLTVDGVRFEADEPVLPRTNRVSTVVTAREVATGTVLWTADLWASIRNGGIAAAGHGLVVARDGDFATNVLDAASGELVWRRAEPAVSHVGPDLLYGFGQDGEVIAFDRDTAQEVGRTSVGIPAEDVVPALQAGGTVWVIDDADLVEVNVREVREVTRLTLDPAPAAGYRTWPARGGVAWAAAVLVYVTDDAAIAVDPSSGRRLWTHVLVDPTTLTGDHVIHATTVDP